MFQDFKCTIEGLSPMIQHNGRLSDPLDPWVKRIKAISSKQKKTDDDHLELGRLEWFGSLYEDDGKIVVPGINVKAMLISGFKANKLGTKGKAAIIAETSPLIYDGPQNINELWAGGKHILRVGVSVGMGSTIMRTRPIFRKWSLNINLKYNAELLNLDDIRRAIMICGSTVGLSDWRPDYGLFQVTA